MSRFVIVSNTVRTFVIVWARPFNFTISDWGHCEANVKLFCWAAIGVWSVWPVSPLSSPCTGPGTIPLFGVTCVHCLSLPQHQRHRAQSAWVLFFHVLEICDTIVEGERFLPLKFRKYESGNFLVSSFPGFRSLTGIWIKETKYVSQWFKLNVSDVSLWHCSCEGGVVGSGGTVGRVGGSLGRAGAWGLAWVAAWLDQGRATAATVDPKWCQYCQHHDGTLLCITSVHAWLDSRLVCFWCRIRGIIYVMCKTLYNFLYFVAKVVIMSPAVDVGFYSWSLSLMLW